MSLCLLLLGLPVARSVGYGDGDFRMFFNLTQALDYFRSDSSQLAESILYTFENDCCVLEERALPNNRRPFIVVEGNQRQSRNVIGMRLARMMQGRYLVHPAHCLQRFIRELPKGTMFRRAFYLLSLYALSFDVKSHLSLGRAAVINGYWWDMLTFALVQAYPLEETPDTSQEMFKFPKDLLQPDLVFFLNFPDNLYIRQVSTRSPQTWKPRVLKIYRDLEKQGVPLIIKDLSRSFRPVTDAMYETIMANLSGLRDVWFDHKQHVSFDYRGH